MDVWYFPKSAETVDLGKYQTRICNNREIPSAIIGIFIIQETDRIFAKELYRYLTGADFTNELKGMPVEYNYKTIHAELFGGKDGYILLQGGYFTWN